MARPTYPLAATAEQLEQLRRVVNQPTAEPQAARRAAIILRRSEGHSQQRTADLVGVRRTVVVEWEKRFRQHGLAGLADAAGRGRKPSLPLALKSRIITQATRPPPGRTRWSCRGMARAVKVSAATVQRLWAANDIKPQVSKAFKLSHDPEFERKFWDVIGLYLNPPHKALIFCGDEKSQLHALERTQRALPLAKGYVRTRRHDYIRHGTITLLAALSYLEGIKCSAKWRRRTRIRSGWPFSRVWSEPTPRD